jgi:hypothetical protein
MPGLRDLFGLRRKRPRVVSRNVPLYSTLYQRPSRTLPDALLAEQSGPGFDGRVARIGAELESRSVPGEEDLVLFTVGSGEGVPPLGTIFTSAFRAIDYGDHALGGSGGFMSLTLAGAVWLLDDLRGRGATHYCLNRCPRCDTALLVAIDPAAEPEDLWRVVTLGYSVDRALVELYLEHARRAVHEGRKHESLEIALETAAHLAIDDPDVHLFIGRLALAIRDANLVREARAMLEALQARTHLERLDEAEIDVPDDRAI